MTALTEEQALDQLDQPFPAVFTPAAVTELRNWLRPDKNNAFALLFGLLLMDRPKMTEFVKSVIAEDGKDDAFDALEVMKDLRKGIADLVGYAEMAEARLFLAFHDACGVSPRETFAPAEGAATDGLNEVAA